ncbi:hypothetical protein NDU88_004925 [Pleurodeles waltl]|uniref:Uncharacterized protein n=1 Tax=Pleurodeles waltl TaxID=8319 RepID=A0AAV7LMQ2_PLEWA|nr:hypothetical protein NDU88_004925 [Pleurodeles waltl]
MCRKIHLWYLFCTAGEARFGTARFDTTGYGMDWHCQARLDTGWHTVHMARGQLSSQNASVEVELQEE